MFTVLATPPVMVAGNRVSVQPDMGEMWEQSDPLVHVHTGLDLPPGKDDDMLDVGPIRITFTTLDDYPDGKMVGAFGDGSGARPDVWICPLWRLDEEDPNDNCSTFAYKWATATVSGSIGGLREVHDQRRDLRRFPRPAQH